MNFRKNFARPFDRAPRAIHLLVLIQPMMIDSQRMCDQEGYPTVLGTLTGGGLPCFPALDQNPHRRRPPLLSSVGSGLDLNTSPRRNSALRGKTNQRFNSFWTRCQWWWACCRLLNRPASISLINDGLKPLKLEAKESRSRGFCTMRLLWRPDRGIFFASSDRIGFT